MNPRDRELMDRVGRLLRAGSPAYPGDLDRRLRKRLGCIGTEERFIRMQSGHRRWALAASLAAAALLVVAGLFWWPSTGSKTRTGAPIHPAPASAVAPTSVPVPPAAPAVRDASMPEPGAEKRPAMRIGDKRGDASGETLRLEFTIPEQAITILWEQQRDFDLAALVAAR